MKYRRWASALWSIQSKKYHWKYFYLTNPPVDKIEKDAYDKAQDDITKEIQALYDKINKMKTEDLKNFLLNKKEEAKKEEKQLFDKVQGQMGLKLDYNNLVEAATTNNTKDKVSDTIKDSIQFWTAAVLGFKNQDGKLIQDLTPEQALALFIGSKEMYDEVKSKLDISFFSRTALLGKKQLNNTVNYKEVFEALEDSISNTANFFIYDANEEIVEQGKLIIQNIFYSVIKEYKNYRLKRKPASAQQFSKILRQRLQDRIEEELETNEILKQIKGNLKIELKSSISGEVALRVYDIDTQKKGSNEFYKGKKLKNITTVEELTDNIINIFNVSINALQNNQTLDLLSLGKISLNQDIIDKAKKALKKETFKKIIRYIQNKENIKKAFDATNSNQYIAGLFGELRGQFTIGSTIAKDLLMTGNVFSEIKGVGFGQSPYDLSNNRFGVQIKHYVTRSGSNLKLYESDTSLNISDKYIKRYFTEEEVELLQYIAANAPFIEEQYHNGSKNLVRILAENELPTFLRIYDQSNPKKVNLFFQINNIVYPLSYIYETALQQIKYLTLKNNKGFFEIRSQNIISKNKFSYPNLDTAIKNWGITDKFKIADGVKHSTILIKTNGLNINLAKFNGL